MLTLYIHILKDVYGYILSLYICILKYTLIPKEKKPKDLFLLKV